MEQKHKVVCGMFMCGQRLFKEKMKLEKKQDTKLDPTDLLPVWLQSAGCTGALVCNIHADNKKIK